MTPPPELSNLRLQQRLAEAFDQSPTPIFVTDAHGAFEFANRAFCRTRSCPVQETCDRYSRDFLLQKPSNNCLPVSPGDVENTLPWRTEMCLTQADGHERWEEVQLSALVDETGHVNGLVGSIRDITLRKKAELALREKDEQLCQVLQASHDSIIILDADGVVRFWNPAASRIYGYSLEEAMGKNITELLVSPHEIEATRRAFGEFRVSGERAGINQTTEFTALRKNRSEITVELSLSALDFDGKRHLLGVSRDVTERKRAERERELLVKSLEEALANVKTLRGLVPICAECKKIRDDSGYWNQLEAYVAAHSEAKFSHGICPECAHKLYPQFASMIEARQSAPKNEEAAGTA